MTVNRLPSKLALMLLLLLCIGCEATTAQIIPTERPTLARTSTQSGTRTGSRPTTTVTATTARSTPTGGPSVTPLFGQAPIASTGQPTATRALSPNAARIEYFEADAESIAPGGELTLFWSTRNVERAVIYRLNQEGQRTLTYNIPPDGRQTITIGQNDRGRVDFTLVVGESSQQVDQTLSIPILCPIVWFFQPAPAECPSAESQPATIIEQSFERGRMLYVSENNQVYALFNDGNTPAWVSFTNQYDAAIHPARDEAFEAALAGTGQVQPVGRLGFVWRGSDTVRNRLGIGTVAEVNFEGFVQRAPTGGGISADSLFLTSSTGTVIQLLPNGGSWQIITPS